MKTPKELSDELTATGRASVELTGISARDARTVLIGAAHAAGVRVSCTRRTRGTVEVMEATVLGAEEALAQSRRAAYQRATRLLGDAQKILQTELITAGADDQAAVDEIVFDLGEIAGELETRGVRV